MMEGFQGHVHLGSKYSSLIKMPGKPRFNVVQSLAWYELEQTYNMPTFLGLIIARFIVGCPLIIVIDQFFQSCVVAMLNLRQN